MKKSILLISLFTMFCSTVHANDTTLPNVTVYGTATTEVTPDQMKWYLTVTNKGSKLKDVADAHTKIVADVLKLLERSGVKEDRTQTARMEFGENWLYRNNTRVREGYFASTKIAFKHDNFDDYKPLWSGLADITYITIDGVYYDHSKRIDYQNQTRIKALLDAKEKAITLAQTLGSEIGEPLLIEEDTTLQNPYQADTFSNSMRVVQGTAAEGDSIAKGKIPIRIRVKASFRLITIKK